MGHPGATAAHRVQAPEDSATPGLIIVLRSRRGGPGPKSGGGLTLGPFRLMFSAHPESLDPRQRSSHSRICDQPARHRGHSRIVSWIRRRLQGPHAPLHSPLRVARLACDAGRRAGTTAVVLRLGEPGCGALGSVESVAADSARGRATADRWICRVSARPRTRAHVLQLRHPSLARYRRRRFID